MWSGGSIRINQNGYLGSKRNNMRKTAADVHLELSVHEKECAERWKTAFNKFADIESDIKELHNKISSGMTTMIVLLVGLICSFVALVIENALL